MGLFNIFSNKSKPKDEPFVGNDDDFDFELPSADVKDAQCRERSPQYPEFWRHWNEDGSCFSPLSASQSIAFEESVKNINRKSVR